MVKKLKCRLRSLWSGGNQRITEMTAIFAWQTSLDFRPKTKIKSWLSFSGEASGPWKKFSNTCYSQPTRGWDRENRCESKCVCVCHQIQYSSDPDYIPDPDSCTDPHLLDQAELNDLVRDLGLTKQKAELLASLMRQWNLLKEETKVTFYRDRNKELKKFFSKTNSTSYCSRQETHWQS